MKSSILNLLIGALLALTVTAQPHRHQHHPRQRHHPKRALEVVWETDWVVVTETVNLVETVWVDGGGVPASTAQAAEFYETTPVSAPAGKQTTAPVAVSVQVVPASTIPPTTLATSTSVYVAPPAPPAPTTAVYVPPPTTAAPVVVVPATTEAPAVVVAAAPEPTTTVAPVVVAPAAAPTTAIAIAPAPAVSSAAPAAASSSSAPAPPTTGGTTGKATFYDTADSMTAPGACGWANDGLKEYVLAFPAGVMGAKSNGNPYCGQMVSISYAGTTIQAKIVDKCPGCPDTGLDLSRAAFRALASEDLGHIQVTWSVIG